MNNKNSIVPSQGGFIKDTTLRLKLIGRLMMDSRVNLFSKILPVGALIYLISPIDIAPDLVLPVIGALDDVTILWMAAHFFIELAPTEVVREHIRNLMSNNAVVEDEMHHTKESQAEDIVDGEVTDL